ncbi:MAG: DNA topoisomerase IV subunit A, partial [Spartobacteria bacterium]|nr:DNA topoisomerase IV subunit A [Spartobacteria bacterium]
LTELARNELFNDELTRFIPNYDGRRKEPVALPSKLPLLLMLGTEGIAVGLSTRILPHNFCELLTAQIAILKKEKFKLLPDFQQGGHMDAGEYDRGNGKIKVRAVIEVRDEATLVIREIPYGTTTDSLIGSIEEAARKKKIKVKSINDFTAGKIEIEIKLASEQKTDKVIQSLYAFTQCEVSISSHIVVIRDKRPVEMDVDQLIRYNTEMLVKLLRNELKAACNNLLEEIHRRTLVQIFVENRIYKWIEECETAETVHNAVLNGVNQYRDELRRDVTAKDIEMLLGIPIRRISLFDMSKSKQDIDKLLAELEKVENNLNNLIPYAIRYLQNLLRKYGGDYPRLTKLKTFKEVELRQLTANELTMYHDRDKGYIGHDIAGDPLFQCSSLDRIILVWNDGRYKVIPPPDKLFVDQHLLYCAIMDRNHVFSLVYCDDQITYMKRFNFGGVILNRDYSCAPEGATILFFSDKDPEHLYVKYKKAKRQRINQQVFHPKQQAVKGVKARGAQMTVKEIRAITDTKPRNWDKDNDAPRGAMIDFV